MGSSTHTHSAPSLGQYWLLPALQDLIATYHPGSNTPDADGLSSSLDSMLFHLPSSVLRQSATFFTLSSFTFIPNRKHIAINRTRCHPHMAITAQVCLNGLAVPPWCTFDDFEVYSHQPRLGDGKAQIYCCACIHTRMAPGVCSSDKVCMGE